MAFLRITTDKKGRAQSEDVTVPSDIRLSEEQKALALQNERSVNRRATQFVALNPVPKSEHQPHPPRQPEGILLEEAGAILSVPVDSSSTTTEPAGTDVAATTKKEKVK